MFDEVVVPVIRDTKIQLLEYGVSKAGVWVEEQIIPATEVEIKTNLKNIKLYISTLRDLNKFIKVEQIFENRRKLSVLEEDSTLVLHKKR